jgi:hypothetical protein
MVGVQKNHDWTCWRSASRMRRPSSSISFMIESSANIPTVLRQSFLATTESDCERSRATVSSKAATRSSRVVGRIIVLLHAIGIQRSRLTFPNRNIAHDQTALDHTCVHFPTMAHTVFWHVLYALRTRHTPVGSPCLCALSFSLHALTISLKSRVSGMFNAPVASGPVCCPEVLRGPVPQSVACRRPDLPSAPRSWGR